MADAIEARAKEIAKALQADPESIPVLVNLVLMNSGAQATLTPVDKKSGTFITEIPDSFTRFTKNTFGFDSDADASNAIGFANAIIDEAIIKVAAAETSGGRGVKYEDKDLLGAVTLAINTHLQKDLKQLAH